MVPERWRHALIRRMISIPEREAPDLKIKIAESRDELEQAYKLLHDCYVEAKIMRPDPSGLRCTMHSALPDTAAVIAVKEGRVVGTVSLVPDSSFGIPSDEDYRTENDFYREQGHRLTEASSLAVEKNLRGEHRISLFLMKYLAEYASRHLKSTMLCGSVHPRAADYYSALFGFVKNGAEMTCRRANGALAIHMTLDLAKARFETLPRLYRSAREKWNLYRFMISDHRSCEYPKNKASRAMTPEMLRYFFMERTDLFSRIPATLREMIQSAHALQLDTVPESAASEINPLGRTSLHSSHRDAQPFPES